MRVIGSGSDDDDRYVAGHRLRRRWDPSLRELGDRGAKPGRTPPGGSRTVRLLTILVVSVPAAVLGAQLGMSTGEVADQGSSATQQTNPPSFTLPVSPSFTLGTPPATSTRQAPASPRPIRSTQESNTPQPVTTRFVVDNFDGSPPWDRSLNDLGEWMGADAFANGRGNGNGVVGGGGLTLVYEDDGWFGSDIKTDVSRYAYLVLRIAGAAGGEQRDFTLALGGVERRFADYTLNGGAHPVITTSYRDIRIPMVANGINTKRPEQLQMSFWWGGRGTIVIDEIRFE